MSCLVIGFLGNLGYKNIYKSRGPRSYHKET